MRDAAGRHYMSIRSLACSAEQARTSSIGGNLSRPVLQPGQLQEQQWERLSLTAARSICNRIWLLSEQDKTHHHESYSLLLWVTQLDVMAAAMPR